MNASRAVSGQNRRQGRLNLSFEIGTLALVHETIGTPLSFFLKRDLGGFAAGEFLLVPAAG